MESTKVTDPTGGVFANGPTSCNSNPNEPIDVLHEDLVKTSPLAKLSQMFSELTTVISTTNTLVQQTRKSVDELRARVEALEPAKNTTPTVSSTEVSSTPASSTPKLSKLEAAVLKVLFRCSKTIKYRNKFITAYEVWEKLPLSIKTSTDSYSRKATVTSAIRRVRAKTGLTIQAAQTTRRATHELSKSETGYRLLNF